MAPLLMSVLGQDLSESSKLPDTLPIDMSEERDDEDRMSVGNEVGTCITMKDDIAGAKSLLVNILGLLLALRSPAHSDLPRLM